MQFLISKNLVLSKTVIFIIIIPWLQVLVLEIAGKSAMKPFKFNDFKDTGFNGFSSPSRCVCLSVSPTSPYQQALELKNWSIN